MEPGQIPWRRRFDDARDPLSARNALGITSLGGGGGAPTTAEYITSSPDATLTAERVLTNTATVTWDFSTPGQAKASTAAGGGNVSNSGTPTAGQYGKWVTATTIQGVAPATVLSDIGAQPAGSYQPLDGDLTSLAAASATNAVYYRSAANTWGPITISAPLTFTGGALAVDLTAYLTTAAAAAAYQPLDADLTAIAALAGTNTIYYRSAANTWAAVTIGTGLTFSGGTLTATGGGSGNVSNVGTPTNGQLAQWTTATTIQGVSLATAGIQPLDATLTALAAYNTNGLLTQTAADTFTGRTLTGPAAGITVSNGSGVAGNPTLALADDLAALEALAGTSTIYYRSGTSAWSAVTIGTGLTFSAGTLSASGGTSASSVPQEGRLAYLTSGQLTYNPFNGNKIKINGTIYTLAGGGAGIAGLQNVGVFVNGTGGQNLAANTTYWVFAFSNSGVVTADFRTAATHAASTTAGNEGVEILTGNDTRSLIGICRTNASAQFVDTAAQRFVRSWFNRLRVAMLGAAVNSLTTASNAFIELGSQDRRIEFVALQGEVASINFTGAAETNVGSGTGWIANGIGMDSATVSSAPDILTFTVWAGYRVMFHTSCEVAMTDGYHYVVPLGATGGGAITYSTENFSGLALDPCLHGTLG